MKMRTYGTFCCAALVALVGVTSAQNVSYPLDIGTKWQWSQYWSSSSYGVEITRDTVASNGHQYAIIPGYFSIPERWERQEGSRVYRYNSYSGQEWLLFDFSKSPGDTINHSPLVVMYAARMDTLFGVSRRTWEFGVGMVPGVPDAGAGYRITDTIGLTDYGDYNSALRVIGAIVGSRTYGTVTDVFNSGGVSPVQILLDQNYPNPFNPSTTIKYELPKSSVVRVSVFDMLGRVVSVLVNERKDAGVHEVKFDDSNLASGVYVYRLAAGDFVQSKKMMILK